MAVNISEAEEIFFCFFFFITSIPHIYRKRGLPMFVQSPRRVMLECGDLKIIRRHKTLD
jgi:hypothetical protein